MVKLICTDVDGTLLNSSREIDPLTTQAFSTIKNKVTVVLASSRMPKALYHLQQSLSVENAPLICYNGGLVLSGGAGYTDAQVLVSFVISEPIISKIALLSRDLDLHISIYHNDYWVANRMDSWTEREINNTCVHPDHILGKDFSNSGIHHMDKAHKIMLMGDSQKIDEIEDILLKDVTVALCRSKSTYLEITPIATNKSIALKMLIQNSKSLKGISNDQIMAFGDNHNDFELLRDVKYGIAVGNGVDELKKIAYAVTGSNLENGVAKYISNFEF